MDATSAAVGCRDVNRSIGCALRVKGIMFNARDALITPASLPNTHDQAHAINHFAVAKLSVRQ